MLCVMVTEGVKCNLFYLGWAATDIIKNQAGRQARQGLGPCKNHLGFSACVSVCFYMHCECKNVA